jgi:hypothetical protein
MHTIQTIHTHTHTRTHTPGSDKRERTSSIISVDSEGSGAYARDHSSLDSVERPNSLESPAKSWRDLPILCGVAAMFPALKLLEDDVDTCGYADEANAASGRVYDDEVIEVKSTEGSFRSIKKGAEAGAKVGGKRQDDKRATFGGFEDKRAAFGDVEEKHVAFGDIDVIIFCHSARLSDDLKHSCRYTHTHKNIYMRIHTHTYIYTYTRP